MSMNDGGLAIIELIRLKAALFYLAAEVPFVQF